MALVHLLADTMISGCELPAAPPAANGPVYPWTSVEAGAAVVVVVTVMMVTVMMAMMMVTMVVMTTAMVMAAEMTFDTEVDCRRSLGNCH